MLKTKYKIKVHAHNLQCGPQLFEFMMTLLKVTL